MRVRIDMVGLEWAHIEAFDGKTERALGPEDLLQLGPDLRVGIQPYVRLLDLQYPVDDLRVRTNAMTEEHGATSNAVLGKRRTDLRKVGRMKPLRIFVAVHRVDFDVYYRRLAADEFHILQAFRNGQAIGKAIESALGNTSLPLEQFQRELELWFAAWAELGWLVPPGKQASGIE